MQVLSSTSVGFICAAAVIITSIIVGSKVPSADIAAVAATCQTKSMVVRHEAGLIYNRTFCVEAR